MEELYRKYVNQGFTHQEAREMAFKEQELLDKREPAHTNNSL